MIFALRHSSTPQCKPIGFTGRCLIVATLTTFTLQCSWTPEVETVLQEGHECRISLKTSNDLKEAPNHPTSLSESLIAKILKGMAISQEEGILQQLLLSTPNPVPAFSPSQIDFLALPLSMAFSQVTPEELIDFTCPPTDEQLFGVQGTLAAFSPSTLLLTLKDLKPNRELPPKVQRSSRKLQASSLTFSHQDAIIGTEEVQAFMTIPSTFHKIAINYQSLNFSNPNNNENQLIQPGRQTTPNKNTEPPMTMDSLNSQLRDLQKKVDQQAEEIRRLQDSSSP